MALTTKSAFFYGLEVTALNYALDFQVGATVYAATLRRGNYTATTLAAEIARAMSEADITHTYSATYGRNVLFGSIVSQFAITGSSAFRFLFASGTRTAVNCAALLGWTVIDTAVSTNQLSNASFGETLEPDLIGYSYQPITSMRKIVGSLNVSASGIKESIIYSNQQFFQVEFKYEPEATALVYWADFFDYATRQNLIEFAEDKSVPAVTIDCTLESTEFDGKGMGYLMKEMLPDFPFFYRTGIMRFRKRPEFLSIV